MFSTKRVLRAVIPVAALALGVTLYAQSRSHDCGHPALVARVMQAARLAHIQPCAVQLTPWGDYCVDVGHHCNVGNGPGKCRNVADPATSAISCQCVSR